ncbi:MAG: hypothetical protein JOZ41_19675 [Chloroflexi bacterium]|nr:hypothetical protein [Chloroflexota bacterium]
MNTDRPADAPDRMNELVVEAAQTLMDAAYLTQRQNAQLFQAWIDVLDANRKAQREVTVSLIRQGQEGQVLLQRLAQEWFRAGVESVAQTADAAFTRARESTDGAKERVTSLSRRGEAGAREAAPAGK